MNWKDLDPKQRRKAIILGVLVALALLILLTPAGGWRRRAHARQEPRQIEKLHAVQPQQRAPIPPPPPADPLAKLIGKWEGREFLQGRGVCHLMLEVKPGTERGSFSGFSTVACTGSAPAQDAKDPAGLMAMMMRPALNQTSASFAGSGVEGSLVLRATDNIGVGQALNGCDMVSMTLKNFGDARASLRWQESGKGVCTGGEMLLGHAR